MVELIIITLIGLTCLGIGLKYCMYNCNIGNENEIVNNNLIRIVEVEVEEDDEVPPKYEDI